MSIDSIMDNMPPGVDAISVTRFRRENGSFFWSASIHVGDRCFSNSITSDWSSFESVYADCLNRWLAPVPGDAWEAAYAAAVARFTQNKEDVQ